MFVLSFFCHVDIHLVAYEEFMTAIAYADGRCVHLVAVSDVEPMETASYDVKTSLKVPAKVQDENGQKFYSFMDGANHLAGL